MDSGEGAEDVATGFHVSKATLYPQLSKARKGVTSLPRSRR
jgi:hypothetical protein